MKTLVIIPAYNEQDAILNTVKDVESCGCDVDVVVINDCSTDATRKILEDNGINHINLPINLGIGGGVQTGYKYALEKGYDIAIQFDGDGQHDASYLGKMIEALEKDGADIAIGSRYVANSKEGFQSTAMRRFGIGFLSCLIRILSGVKVYDVTSGMRAVNKKMIEVYANDYEQDYPEPEAILLAGLKGAVIKEVPVVMRERQGGKSSISSWKSAYYMIKVSMALIIYRAINKKVKK